MAGFKIKMKVDAPKLKSILQKQQALIQHNVAEVLKQEAIPFLITRIMIGYDSLSERANMLPEDPTNPANWRVEFLAKLHTELEQTFIVTGNRVSVRLGEKDFLGYNPSGEIDTDDTQPLHWLVFFLEGLIGDWAFISPENYTKITKRPYQVGWGRFEQGFMVSKQDYQEQGWDKVIPFAEVRHPFSGYSPVDIFAEALREFRLRPFIQKAINAAVKGRRL
jgi:hypothetical protein